MYDYLVSMFVMIFVSIGLWPCIVKEDSLVFKGAWVVIFTLTLSVLIMRVVEWFNGY